MSAPQSPAEIPSGDTVAKLAAVIDRDPSNPQGYVALGRTVSKMGRFADAETWYRKAIELDASLPAAHNGLGRARQMQGDAGGAIASYQHALQLDAGFGRARVNLATLLVRLGRWEESLPHWRAEVCAEPDRLRSIADWSSAAMRSGDFTVAADFASVHAAIRWGSPWYPPRRKAAPAFEQLPAPAPSLTIPKLEHDVEQFVYLQERGVLGSEFTEIIREYERVVERLSAIGTGARELLTGDEWTRIGHVYNRIVHLRRSPRMQRALSKSWRGADVEEEYLAKPPGIVVVDDFLTPAALEEVRRFCLEFDDLVDQPLFPRASRLLLPRWLQFAAPPPDRRRSADRAPSRDRGSSPASPSVGFQIRLHAAGPVNPCRFRSGERQLLGHPGRRQSR